MPYDYQVGEVFKALNGIDGEFLLVQLDHRLDSTPVVIGYLDATADDCADRLDLQRHAHPSSRPQ
ncbi:hypothetical protein SLNWT_0134 [Streptomyces albus]|uniref:Uncharacterized protein n=1 Tax=Streptomyces albus (strain ATCC 21838 / DSM 41398 / FERM P-419 / JCM 4703 / NBRC 107858) TaxID=1081613 RepID=A0A0B5EMD0_STRA4|nr:hypothetical protein SLNWT_0134 [Streptomyces albus]AOU74829.1 hypothetical protein SLNHY_0138 [Streptomyces albus]AYN30638.1 hypothetical protein DUI70_0135 [Streptomyces albus]